MAGPTDSNARRRQPTEHGSEAKEAGQPTLTGKTSGNHQATRGRPARQHNLVPVIFLAFSALFFGLGPSGSSARAAVRDGVPLLSRRKRRDPQTAMRGSDSQLRHKAGEDPEMANADLQRTRQRGAAANRQQDEAAAAT